MKLIYLAGAINGCTDEEANGWRDWVIHELGGLHAFLNPMDRDYRGVEGDNAQELVEQDLADIEAADVVLVNAARPSWGTAMEVWQAGMWGKEIVVVCSGRVSPWLRFVARSVHATLDDAIAYLRGVE